MAKSGNSGFTGSGRMDIPGVTTNIKKASGMKVVGPVRPTGAASTVGKGGGSKDSR